MSSDRPDAPLACKFGGTSVADARQLARVRALIAEDPRRRYIVVSAPGKRHAKDKKVTDLLYLCRHTAQEGLDAGTVFALIRERYETIGRDLNVRSVSAWLDEVEAGIAAGTSADWTASRGEYLHARLVADYLGATFVDAFDCIRFAPDGRLDP